MSLSFKNRFITVHFTDRPLSSVSGFLIDASDDWMLLEESPDKFKIDGFVIIKNKNIRQIEIGDYQKFQEKVNKKENSRIKLTTLPSLDNLSHILKYIDKHFKLFHFDLTSEKFAYVGKIKKIQGNVLEIDFLDHLAQWQGQMKFRMSNIRVIRFKTHYLKILNQYANK